MMFKGKDTGLFSETFFQVMVGVGLPSAVQFRLTLSPLFSACSSEMCVIFGPSLKRENNNLICFGIHMILQQGAHECDHF